MPYNHNIQSGETRGKTNIDNGLVIKKLLSLIFTKWYLYFGLIAVAFLTAFLYIKFTTPVYKVSATLLINEANNGISLENSHLLNRIGLEERTTNLENQIMILKSRMLINKTLDELHYDIEYYNKDLFKKVPLYPITPIRLYPENKDSIPQDIEFKLTYSGNSMFNLRANPKDSVKFKTTTSFGSVIQLQGKKFRIANLLNGSITSQKTQEIYFINHDWRKLVHQYQKLLNIQPLSEDGTMINLSLEGSNRKKDADFLNKLIEIFLYSSLEKKNEEASRIIQFIDDQLIGISDSLVIAETKLQQFRSTHKVMDLSAQGQAIIEQAMNLENEKARIEIESNYYNYLADYLTKDKAGEVPIAPATIGITDPGLTRLVADLADLQSQYYSKSLGEMNPLQNQLIQRIRITKEALKETLSGVMRANNLARNEIASQIRAVNAQATALPITERQLLGIERKFKLNDELYTFLLEKRAEAQIEKASNMPDNELIDNPDASVFPIKPRKPLIYLLALMSSFFIIIADLGIRELMNDKVRSEADVSGFSPVPISGHIPLSHIKKTNVMVDSPDSSTAEAFRSLRYRIQYITRDIKNPVITISSSMPMEGKSFTSINLASAFSSVGKKTILVGFDLRKPSIGLEFGYENERGLSDWFINQVEIDDIIKETIHGNLFILPEGPVPPNPGEISTIDRTNELLKILKSKFDYIIIDTPPMGAVLDAFHLTTVSDICIIVIRQNVTLKYLLEHTLNELKSAEAKNINVIMNGIKTNLKKYYAYERNL